VALDLLDHLAPMASLELTAPQVKTELQDPTETMPLLEAVRLALALQDPQALLDHADLVAPLVPQELMDMQEPLVPRGHPDLLEPQDLTEIPVLMVIQDPQVPQAKSPPDKAPLAPQDPQDQLALRDHQDPLVLQEIVEALVPQDPQETQDPMAHLAALALMDLQDILVPLVAVVLAATAHHLALPLDSLLPKPSCPCRSLWPPRTAIIAMICLRFTGPSVLFYNKS
jgi:hypothetical protein